jgi:hypothetical protein
MGRDTFGPHLAVGGAHIAKVNVVINSMGCNSALGIPSAQKFWGGQVMSTEV